MKNRKMLLPVIFMMFAFLFSGCGVEQNMQINRDLSSKNTMKIYTTKEEEAQIEKELAGEVYGSYQEMMKQIGFAYKGTEKRSGVVHNVYQTSQRMSAKDTKEEFVVLNKNQAVLDLSELSEMIKEEVEPIQKLDEKALSFYIKYPFKVYKANGKIQKDHYTVQYSLKDIRKNVRLYAVSSAKYANDRNCEISGVKNNAYYRKNKAIKLKSDGVITNFQVNKVSQVTNTYTAKKEGVYRIKVKMLAGNTKSVKFTIDKTKPVTNIESKTYKNRVKINFRDRLSGVKHALLNGKSIKNGKVVSKKGSYVLKISDKAGNVKTVRFSIK